MLAGSVIFLFFFVKQKTAYEMRISDWSSDVCSSDLVPRIDANFFVQSSHALRRKQGVQKTPKRRMFGRIIFHRHLIPAIANQLAETGPAACRKVLAVLEDRPQIFRTPEYPGRVSGRNRSEEHTSELQSLMRISYAVFCLKKKISN